MSGNGFYLNVSCIFIYVTYILYYIYLHVLRIYVHRICHREYRESLDNMLPLDTGILPQLTRWWSFWPKLVTKSQRVVSFINRLHFFAQEICWYSFTKPQKIRYGRLMMIARWEATFFILVWLTVCYGSILATSTQGCGAVWITCLTPSPCRCAPCCGTFCPDLRRTPLSLNDALKSRCCWLSPKTKPCRNGT